MYLRDLDARQVCSMYRLVASLAHSQNAGPPGTSKLLSNLNHYIPTYNLHMQNCCCTSKAVVLSSCHSRARQLLLFPISILGQGEGSLSLFLVGPKLFSVLFVTTLDMDGMQILAHIYCTHTILHTHTHTHTHISSFQLDDSSRTRKH